MSAFRISVIPGDGIGPEVCRAGVRVLEAVAERCGRRFIFSEFLAGGAAIAAHGMALPQDTLKGVKDSQALLFGALGDPKYDDLPPQLKPESALLQLRSELRAFANLRPTIVYDELVDASPLKSEIVRGTDIMLVRELTGGIYFGEPRGIDEQYGERRGFNTMTYRTSEIDRIARIGFTAAMTRRKKLCSVDKSNALEVSQLWREVVNQVAQDYPQVELSHMYVDNAAMQLIRNPRQFDVIVTANLFGDILSDEASQLSGSIGMAPSASFGGQVGLFEPIHGSAPDIAGKGIANPLAMIASAEMLLRYGLKLHEEANLISRAIHSALADGMRTADIKQHGSAVIGTTAMADAVIERLK
jgi:3-isopropylmalate dehydrogenase